MSYPSVVLSNSYMTVVMPKRYATVSFYPHLKKRKGRLHYLYARLIYMRKKAEFSLGVMLSLDEWDFNKGKLINKNKNMNVQKIMVVLESEVLKILEDRQLRGLPVSAKIIKRIVDGKMEHDSTEGAVNMLLPYMDEMIDLMRKKSKCVYLWNDSTLYNTP